MRMPQPGCPAASNCRPLCIPHVAEWSIHSGRRREYAALAWQVRIVAFTFCQEQILVHRCWFLSLNVRLNPYSFRGIVLMLCVLGRWILNGFVMYSE